jgi:hypothetical protein
MKQRWVRLRVAGVANVVGVVATSPRIGRVDSTSALENDNELQLLRLIASAYAACCCCCCCWGLG